MRRMVSFQKLISPDALPAIKLAANTIEHRFADDQGREKLTLIRDTLLCRIWFLQPARDLLTGPICRTACMLTLRLFSGAYLQSP